jgi:hypothetical protein
LARTVFKRMELVNTWKQNELTDWLTNQLNSVQKSTSWEIDNIWVPKFNSRYSLCSRGWWWWWGK